MRDRGKEKGGGGRQQQGIRCGGERGQRKVVEAEKKKRNEGRMWLMLNSHTSIIAGTSRLKKCNFTNVEAQWYFPSIRKSTTCVFTQTGSTHNDLLCQHYSAVSLHLSHYTKFPHNIFPSRHHCITLTHTILRCCLRPQ